jgi:hypothetical protein
MSNFNFLTMKKLLITLSAAGLLFMAGCKKDDGVETTVFVSTSSVTNITSISATGAGDVDLVGVESMTERGICWNSDSTQKPTIDNNKAIANGTGRGHFDAQLMGLVSGTDYYARAYVINNGQAYYGNEVKFTASVPVELISNGDFKLPDDNVKYLNLNEIPNWKTDDTSQDLTGREYDPWRNTGCAYINDWANFYQVVADVPAVKSTYKIKFDASYIYTYWAPYAPKFYVIFSTFTDSPSNRTPIGTIEIPSGVEYPADQNSNWKAHEANFSIPAGSPYAGKKLVIEWAMENYKTESWGWSDTWFDFDNISVVRTLQ